jgi:amidase
MRTVIAGKPWLKDPLAIKKAWDEDAYQLSEHGGRGAKLCFAICWDDGKVRPHPPIIRGLEIAKKALIAAGHHGMLKDV